MCAKLCLLGLITGLFVTTAEAESSVSVALVHTDGELIHTVSAHLENSDIMISIPDVLTLCGYRWFWNSITEELLCTDGHDSLVFISDNPFVTINGIQIQIPQGPRRKGPALILQAGVLADVLSSSALGHTHWDGSGNRMVFSHSKFAQNHKLPQATVPADPVPLTPEPIVPETVPVRTGPPEIKTIVIDPGHGGKDPGAIGPSGILEKNVVLNIALQLRKFIQDSTDMKVYLTRDDDTFIPLRDRTQFANDKKADIFISIHANSIGGSAKKKKQVRGYKIYFLSQAKNETDKMVAMLENSVIEFEDNTSTGDYLQNILTHMAGNEYLKESQDISILIAEEMATSVSEVKSLHKGVGQARFWVLNGAFMPSVLVETAFISHPREEALLNTEKFQTDIARAMFSALVRFKRMYEAGL